MANIEIDIDEYIDLDNIETYINDAGENEIRKIIKYCKERQMDFVNDVNNHYGIQDYVYEMQDETASEFLKWLKHYKPYLFNQI